MNLENRYGIYFTRNGTTYRIPVNPEEIKIRHDADTKDYNVLGIGPIIVPRIPELRVVEWESFFPASADDPYVLTPNGFKMPAFYIGLLKELQESLEPFSFTINSGGENPAGDIRDSFDVILTDFETEEKGGETGDVYYSLKLVEYKEYAATTVSIIKPATVSKSVAAATQEAPRPVPKKELVVGARAIANGKWWYSSWGAKPYGNANNREGSIVRIVDKSRAKPYLFSQGNTTSGTGWMSADELTPI